MAAFSSTRKAEEGMMKLELLELEGGGGQIVSKVMGEKVNESDVI